MSNKKLSGIEFPCHFGSSHNLQVDDRFLMSLKDSSWYLHLWRDVAFSCLEPLCWLQYGGRVENCHQSS